MEDIKKEVKQILIIGAGKSSTLLIDYLLENAAEGGWKVILGDLFREQAQAKLQDSPHGEAIFFDVHDHAQRESAIKGADLVISMLPARFHHLVVRECIRFKVDFLSASYISDEILNLKTEIDEAGIIVMKECGLDPGIDHMSAMEKLDALRASGAKIRRFETFTGGLVAPESENNPWKYKFTWNPRNVVLAGQGTVKFKHNGRYKYIPYHRLFGRYEMLEIPDFGKFEGYPNRDSLKYRETYGLTDVDTIYRGTLRRPGFCKAWDVFVQLGMTDDSYLLEGLENMTWRDYINSFLWWDPAQSVELKLSAYMKFDMNNEVVSKLSWLGIFEDKPIGMDKGTPAQVLQKLLEEKLKLEPEDRDMIVMLHKFVYDLDGKTENLQSSMVVTGDDSTYTAMAKTVGLPLGIAAKHILQGNIKSKGIVMPTIPEVYSRILPELKNYGIEFTETSF